MGRPRTFDDDAAVAAAMDLFWERGYRATTPAELGTAMGIGRGSLYHAFGSKHALFQRALDRYAQRQTAAFVDALEAGGPAVDRLRTALGLVLETPPDPRGCLVTTAAVEAAPDDGTTADAVRAVLTRQVDALRLAIEDGRRRGEFAPGRDAAVVAEAMLAALTGARVLHRAGHPSGPGLVDALMRML